MMAMVWWLIATCRPILMSSASTTSVYLGKERSRARARTSEGMWLAAPTPMHAEQVSTADRRRSIRPFCNPPFHGGITWQPKEQSR